MLFLPVKKTRSDVPLFLLYAGIIHAIGLALLLPMLITLPDPEPKDPAFDVIVLPSPETLVDVGPEHSSALPLKPQTQEGRTMEAAAPGAESVNPSPRSETSAVPVEDGPPGR